MYIKKFSKVKQSNGITGSQLFDCNDELVTESKQIADILQNQFVSVFSNPANTDKSIPPETQQRPTQTLSDFTFNIDNIISAINEININSSYPDYSIPAPVLKHCKSQLANPLFLMWSESLKTGHVPSFYKRQVVVPVYKKGSRATASNYRPISLTAHEVKICERILRNIVVTYLEENNLLSSNQHGFCKGKSCLTQLLGNYDDILSNLLLNQE